MTCAASTGHALGAPAERVARARGRGADLGVPSSPSPWLRLSLELTFETRFGRELNLSPLSLPSPPDSPVLSLTCCLPLPGLAASALERFAFSRATADLALSAEDTCVLSRVALL